MTGGKKQSDGRVGRASSGKGIGMVQVCQVGAAAVRLADAENNAGWPQMVVDLHQRI